MEKLIKTNRQVVEEWQRIIDSKMFDQLGIVESADVENMNPSGTFKGITAHKQMLTAFVIAFPDYIHENFNFIEQDEWIAMEGVFSGTHSGPLKLGEQTVPATNKKMVLPYGGFIRVRNGKVAKNILYYDSKIFLNQIGLE